MKRALVWLIGAGVLTVGVVAVAATRDRCVRLKRGAAYRFLLNRDFNGELDEVSAMGFVSITTNLIGDPMHPDAIDVQGIWAGQNDAEFCPPKGMTPPEFVGQVLQRLAVL